MKLPDIALVGKAGVGKTTSAEFLQELNSGYRKIAFAGRMRQLCDEFGWPADRAHLQALGQKMREIDPDVWLKPVSLAIDEWHYQGTQGHPLVCDDARFENEIAMLESYGFVTIRITATRQQQQERLTQNGRWQGEKQLDHATETQLDDYRCQYTIDNTGDTVQLYEELTAIVNKEAR